MSISLLKNYIKKSRLLIGNNKNNFKAVLSTSSNNFILSTNQLSRSKWPNKREIGIINNYYLNRQFTRALSFTKKCDFR